LLTYLQGPDFPVPVGVYRAISEATYEDLLEQQIQTSLKSTPGDLQKLLVGTESWEVS
jgi:2-oxoglutarate ferredoxin oxidoreductase subunit beta